MPNHITTVIEIKDVNGMKMEDITSVFLNEEGNFDFNKVIPMPKCLEDFNPHSGITTTAEAILQTPMNGNIMIASLEIPNRVNALEKYDSDNISEEDKKGVERAIANYKECGYIYWYDWSNANWETKWNAYDQSRDGNIFRFNTAWSHPDKIIKTVSERLSGVIIDVKYADEDMGSNCGMYSIKDGEILEEDIAPPYSKMTLTERAAYTKLAFSILYKDEDPRSMGYDENWEYSDETYEQYELEQKDD